MTLSRELTPAEDRTILLLVRGLTYEEAGRELGIAAHTVQGRIDRAKIRLGADTLPALVLRWIAWRAGIDADTFYRRLAREIPSRHSAKSIAQEPAGIV